MDQENPLFVSLPNVLSHLDARLLPTDDPSPAVIGPIAAGKHGPVQAAHTSTGTDAREPGNTLTHLVPHSAYTRKVNTYPAATICRRCLQNAQNLLHRGAEDGKRHHVYNARTVPSTWRGHSVCQI